MVTVNTLRDRAREVGANAREQVHVYVGANDYIYEQARRRLANTERPSFKIDPKQARSKLEAYKPAKLGSAVRERVEDARSRRGTFAVRGKEIIDDWQSAFIVQDVKSLVGTVRKADGAGDTLNGVRAWVKDLPADGTSAVVKPLRKPAKKAVKSAKKPAATKPAKATAAKTAQNDS